ncbi:MAG: DNA repair protein RadA [Ruminiclostridium sp.]|nr:DNA repair protein RadA [Ruminiclostridium sp.]
MAKQKVSFICNECGHIYPKWVGRCTECGEWNSVTEQEEIQLAKVKSGRTLKPKNLSDISVSDDMRYKTGSSELDRVLGGGLVGGSLVLLSGDPGIGKSTLLLQICKYLGKECKVLYVSGEESERQIKLRADRLGVDGENLYLLSDNDCEAINAAVAEEKPDVVIIDSIQTMQITELSSAQGSITQVRECTSLFLRTAKTMGIPFFIVGHVNKDGGIAGPKVLEHIVDTVLYFEGDKQLSYRLLRAVKNRFGSTNEMGVFRMCSNGLEEVPNPSEMLLSGRPENVSGISVLCTMEGTRPLLSEVQALVTKTGFGTPRRASTGFDYNRLCLILAVLEKRTGYLFTQFDVYVNVTGGLRLDEPAADAAVALALYSGLCDRVIPEGVAVFGEIGLGGEMRGAAHAGERIRECKRMGFDTCIVPKSALSALRKEDCEGIRVIGASNLTQLFKAAEKCISDASVK